MLTCASYMRRVWSVRKKSPRPHYMVKPFGNISVVVLGDFKQLPPVCDSPLFKANGIKPSGYNLYQLFDQSITFTELVRQQGADKAGFIATCNSYIVPPFLPSLVNSVTICSVTTDWHSQNTKLTRMMLPITVCYA